MLEGMAPLSWLFARLLIEAIIMCECQRRDGPGGEARRVHLQPAQRCQASHAGWDGACETVVV